MQYFCMNHFQVQGILPKCLYCIMYKSISLNCSKCTVYAILFCSRHAHHSSPLIFFCTIFGFFDSFRNEDFYMTECFSSIMLILCFSWKIVFVFFVVFLYFFCLFLYLFQFVSSQFFPYKHILFF